MKRFYYLFLACACAVMAASCDNGKNGAEGVDPEGNKYYEFPLVYEEEGFDGGDNGVTINVSDVKEENIKFNLVPGSAVKSYRMTVYPKAMLYNLLLNEGCVEATQEKCEKVLIELLSNSTVFNSGTEDYAAKEFDWMNTVYAAAPIVPDCEYFIIAIGYYDNEGQNPASISIGHLTTPVKEIVGDPQISIEAETGYSAFIVRYHPNEDCRYFYHWVWSTEEIGEYIDLFGEKLMRDFCRSAVSEPYDATLEENLAIKRSTDIRKNTAVAIALDANKTPAQFIVRNDFEMKVIPEGDFTPIAKIEAGGRLGATVAYFDVEMEKTCMSCFYRLYNVEDAIPYIAGNAEAKAAEAMSIAAEGWGVSNTRFSFNTETETLTGSAMMTTDEYQAELKPDTEYIIGYVAKNYFGELSELKFSKPFKTKKLIRDTPDKCEADINLYFTDITRWGFKYNFEYDFNKTAAFRFQLVWPYDETAENKPPHYINDRNNREKWMTFFYDTFYSSPAGFQTSIANIWTPEKSGYDGYSMFGYDSGVTYVIAYCAEDLDGRVGPVKFAEVATTEAVPGPNPKVEIESIRYDEENKIVTGKFKTNQDSKVIKYFGVGAGDALYASCALNDLVNNPGRRTYEDFMNLWESQLVQLGLSSNAESVTFGVNCDKVSDTPVLVAAVAIGEKKDANGAAEDVYSEVACKIYYKGEFKDLSDFRTPAAK